MNELKNFDPRKSEVVELRYFGGLSLEETAEALEISVMTVRRDWRAAKAWLFRRMRQVDDDCDYDAASHQTAIGDHKLAM
jgi:RNA polymerase sigma-70 factor (ECF subfamily)